MSISFAGRRPSTRFLKRFVLPSDSHSFIGRVFDLSNVALRFDSYEELARHADCKYVIDVNYELTGLTRRVESLNMVGGMLWPDPIPKTFEEFPISRYEWLTVIADAFLMRYISVLDCSMLLSNEVLEVGLERHKCTIGNLEKGGIPESIYLILKEIRADQGALRGERNARFHHGEERSFVGDDDTFRMAAQFESYSMGVGGLDRHGRRINAERSFKEGLVDLQREFNHTTRKLVRQLDRLYGKLGVEFESRFIPRFRADAFSGKRCPDDKGLHDA